MAQTQQLSWIGLQVQDCIVDKLVGEGAYSWVYGGTSLSGASTRAFKLAKPEEFIGAGDASAFQTQARALFTGGSRDIVPDAALLLKRQFEKLKAADDPALVRVNTLLDAGETTFYDMEMIDGPSLRELMSRGAVPLEILAAVADAMARLSNNSEFAHHGDLKPDNILCVGAQPRLIDPGYFGAIPAKEGNFRKVAVTTVIYYPAMRPNDIFAFGLMLWEIACKNHPLLIKFGTEYDTSTNATQTRELDRLVNRYRATGNSNLNNFLHLAAPRGMNPHVAELVQDVILKCLGMKVVDNRLELGESFRTFGEVSSALKACMSAGVKEI